MTALAGVPFVRASSEARSDSKKRAPKQPNVLVLMSDQHRPDLMSCAGNNLVPTPNIDRIARRGVRFEHAYCPYPVCAPSRMSFLTGRFPHNHGVVTNNQHLDWNTRTMAHHFGERGYQTGLIGKMHFANPHGYGFEYRLSINDWLMSLGPKVEDYADEIASDPAFAMFDRVTDSGSGLPILPDLWSRGSPWSGHVGAKNQLASRLAAEEHLDSFVARESCRFMRSCQQQSLPFFLVAGFMKPHAPFYPPPGWAERYDPDTIGLRTVGDTSSFPQYIQDRIERYKRLGEARLRFRRAGYLGNLAFLDSCIGTVYDCLEELGLIDNTIVIYTSDHGEMDGQHGLYQKFFFFEPSVGVPLIISYPGEIAIGTTKGLVSQMGVYPTLIDLLEGARLAGADADSFLPLLRHPGTSGPDAVFAEYGLSWAPRYMVRTARHKYILNEGELHELYDLENDPTESRNRVQDPAYRRERELLHERLTAWYDPADNPFRPDNPNYSGGYPPTEIRFPDSYQRRQ